MTMDEWNKENDKTVEVLSEDDIEVVSAPKMGNAEPNTTAQNEPVKSSTHSSSMATVGLLLGIGSIIFGLFFAGAPWIGILMGTAAIVMGAVERKSNNSDTKGLATGALACGIVGVVFSVIFGIIVAIIGTVLKGLVGILKWLF